MLKNMGFTLIEVLVVVLIIAILIGVGIPSYQQYLTKARRTEAISQLWIAAGQLEQDYGEYHRYTQADGESPELSLPTNKNYSIQVVATPTTYTLSAIPLGSQAQQDVTCGTLTLTDTGQREATGNTPDKCW